MALTVDEAELLSAIATKRMAAQVRNQMTRGRPASVSEALEYVPGGAWLEGPNRFVLESLHRQALVRPVDFLAALLRRDCGRKQLDRREFTTAWKLFGNKRRKGETHLSRP